MNSKQVRWTQEHAASEFGINPRTISARIKQLSIEAGEDGKYSTKQIATAVYGDLERERIGLTAAEREAQERLNLVADKKLVDIETLKLEYAPIYVEMKRQILGSKMSETEKDDLLLSMAKLHEEK